MRRPTLSILAVIAGAAACWHGCVNRFEDHSAYKEMPYLCGRADEADSFDPELEERIEACRAAGPESCAGILNFMGELEDAELTVLLELAGARILTSSAGGATLAELGMAGVGPYTRINFEFKTVGGAITDDLDTEHRTRTLNQGGPVESLTDNSSEMLVRLESRTVTTIRSQAGSLNLTRVSRSEVRGRFFASAYRISGAGDEVKDDAIEGCFHLFGE